MRGFTLDHALIVVASLVLLAVDWLAFHDFREPHTGRDWLTLLASVLVFVHSALALRRRDPA